MSGFCRARAASFLLFQALAVAPLAQAREHHLDSSAVLEVLDKPQSYVLGAADLGMTFNEAETKSTQSTQYDDAYVASLRAAAAYAITPQFAVRTLARGNYSDRLRQNEGDSRTKLEERATSADGNLDVSYAAQGGFDVFGGAAWAHVFKSTQKRTLPAVSSESKYGTATLVAPRLGLLKRSGNWAAGFYYDIGSEKKRGFNNVTQDIATQGEEYVTLPSTFAGLAKFAIGNAFEVDLALAMVMLGDSEAKDGQGNDLYKDYYRVHFSVLYPLTAGMGLFVGVTHRTIGYAEQASLSLESIDTIPITDTEIRLDLGKDTSRLFLGALLSFGQDSQSIPDLNADYTHKAWRLRAGVSLPM